MTPTSDERRDIAARLRALPIDTYAAIREWEKDGLFIDASLSDEADYSQIHNAVLGCFPAEYVHPGDRKELHERLADLIDPTCEVMDDNRWTSDFAYVCRACGEHFSTCNKPHYCPGCGARVVRDDD